MSQSIRQSELFAGEEWTVLYRAFTQVNFNAFDYDTIRSSMVDYIRFNYPEDFNDWIESSEFVAIIDLLSYLGQSLAFRTDINAQETFIDTAERRESLLKMARLLSYQVSRNVPARGFCKIERISTTEPLIDSLGQILQNLDIYWDDANNPDWYEQWMILMNSVFISESQFGQPVQSETINGIPTQLYECRVIPSGTGEYSFSTSISNESMQFEVVNPTISDNGYITEQTPNPLYAFNMIYRNDGNGNSSPTSGFFVYFKQGSKNFQDFTINTPMANRILNVDATNINQFDVWVQTINEEGLPYINWTKVPAIVGSNIVYNSINKNTTTVYSVLTEDNDKISLRFSDGVFGSVPVGNIRCYYRRSNNKSYTIYPKDMSGITIRIPYFNVKGEKHVLTIRFSLQQAISNSAVNENIERIRTRAPQVYYTQNRMVNGEDYNVFPLQNTEILKLKAINRVYSGHSRYIDINDPTSTYQDVNVVADDGAIYLDYKGQYIEIPFSANKTPGEIISKILFTLMKDIKVTQFFYHKYPHIKGDNGVNQDGGYIVWNRATNAAYSSTGCFIGSSSIPTDSNLGNSPLGDPEVVGLTKPANDPADYISQGTLVRFKHAGWVKVERISDFGNGFFDSGKGKITLSEPVLTNDQVMEIFPTFRTDMISDETNNVLTEIESNNSFGLRYDHALQEWKIIRAANLAPVSAFEVEDTTSFSLDYAGNNSLQSLDDSWLIRFDFVTDGWIIRTRGVRYVWESEHDVRFFTNSFYKIVSGVNAQSSRDRIKIFKTEPKPDGSSNPLGEDLYFNITDLFTYEDGYTEPRRAVIGFTDMDSDGVPDNPNTFFQLVEDGVNIGSSVEPWQTYIFHSSYTDQFGYVYMKLDSSIIPIPSFSLLSENTNRFHEISNGGIIWNYETKKFYEFVGSTIADRKNQSKYQERSSEEYSYHKGRQGINFMWKHVASKDNRIDPAKTNIIDMLVLTSAYNDEYREWIDSKQDKPEPHPPTSEDLRLAFSEMEEFKMVSDHMIWKPAKFKPLFGSKARDEYKAKFKVVKIPSSTISEGDLKSRIIQTINNYFTENNWDFGETFFSSELLAYIHARLAGIIGGIELVPMNDESSFGNLSQIKANSDEIFVSTAKVDDVEVVKAFTETVLRIKD